MTGREGAAVGRDGLLIRDLDGNRICFASPARAVPEDGGDVRRAPRSRTCRMTPVLPEGRPAWPGSTARGM
jgi:hypothetical protein